MYFYIIFLFFFSDDLVKITFSEVQCEGGIIPYDSGDQYYISRDSWCKLCTCKPSRENFGEFECVNHTNCNDLTCSESATHSEKKCCHELGCQLGFVLPPLPPIGGPSPMPNVENPGITSELNPSSQSVDGHPQSPFSSTSTKSQRSHIIPNHPDIFSTASNTLDIDIVRISHSVPNKNNVDETSERLKQKSSQNIIIIIVVIVIIIIIIMTIIIKKFKRAPFITRTFRRPSFPRVNCMLAKLSR